jgi:hypothetical protein
MPAVPEVVFTRNLQRHVACPTVHADGSTVREVLDAVFAANPQARGYVLDDQGALRKHMVVFIDGRQLQDRVALTDPVQPASELYIMQALSGG